jgi:hypothetical protein
MACVEHRINYFRHQAIRGARERMLLIRTGAIQGILSFHPATILEKTSGVIFGAIKCWVKKVFILSILNKCLPPKLPVNT